jgi:DMSO/TMAO reductase YedYZ molybdopterin-dependent catalytic subunit
MAILDPIKRVQRLRQAQPKRERDTSEQDRIPPGQYRTDKFPVLSYGPTPRIKLKDWRLRIFGLVEKPFEIDWAEFTSLSTTIVKTDIHCVTPLESIGHGVGGCAVSRFS